jgi:predicted transcriptional regulator of viral defense system
MKTSNFIANLVATGRFHFTLDETVAALGGSVVAVRSALLRLQQKGQVALPYRGFYVVVPPEFRRLGCLPAEQFIPQLMSHLGEPYYVALLSAAELHGAAHHRPQAFQVMLKANRRPIECGAVRVQFLARKNAEKTAVVERNTPRGPLRSASPEATALELVGYADQSGGLD